MYVWGWVGRGITSIGAGGSGGGIWVASGGRWHVGVAVVVTAMAGLALAATLVISSRRDSLKSPWSRRKRKHALSRRQWTNFFAPDGKLRDGGIKLLKKVRSGGIDPSIRPEVWPFLLGVYSLNSTEVERDVVRKKKSAEYESLTRRCSQLLKQSEKANGLKAVGDDDSPEGSPTLNDGSESPACSEVFNTGRPSLIGDQASNIEDQPVLDKTPDYSASNVDERSNDGEDLPVFDKSPQDSSTCDAQGPSGITLAVASAGETESSNVKEGSNDGDDLPVFDKSPPESGTCDAQGPSGITQADPSAGETESSDSESSVEDHESMLEPLPLPEPEYEKLDPLNGDQLDWTPEDFETWQRIIRLDAVRANPEWIIYSPNQTEVSDDEANRFAAAVGLKDYDHLEPCMIRHAARLVSLLEAYAIYDPEIGYCQGMSDLLSPIIAVMEADHEAFWCFTGFMRKARHNFRLDEVGIRRQLGIVAKIIRSKDLHLYQHLEKLQAEDCFFVYRMVVVLFRWELSFEQTLCLWEVMWADQAAIRAAREDGVGPDTAAGPADRGPAALRDCGLRAAAEEAHR